MYYFLTILYLDKHVFEVVIATMVSFYWFWIIIPTKLYQITDCPFRWIYRKGIFLILKWAILYIQIPIFQGFCKLIDNMEQKHSTVVMETKQKNYHSKFVRNILFCISFDDLVWFKLIFNISAFHAKLNANWHCLLMTNLNQNTKRQK